MTWLDKLQRRLGFIAIPGLPRILVGFTALVFVLGLLLPGFVDVLDLDPNRVLHGEVWRLVTYIFVPPTSSPIWILFALWFVWWIADGLERAMGAFKLTLYMVISMIGTTAAAFFWGSQFSNTMLTASLF
jgi:membrane associated rhomboid family serine protease